MQLRRFDAEGEPIDFVAEEVRREMPVDVDGEPRILVAEDALHCRGARACLHQEARGRVPEIVEADRTDLRLRPELRGVDGAAAKSSIGRQLGMVAALLPADLAIARDDAGAPHRAAQDALERDIGPHHPPLGAGEDELRG